VLYCVTKYIQLRDHRSFSVKFKSKIANFSQKDVNITQVNVRYDGFFKMLEYQLSHKLFNGEYSQEFTREVFERGDAVVLIPYDPVRDSLVINQQFRVGALRTEDNPWLLEFVAGMFGPNEQAKDVAIREAKEEANLDVNIEDIEPVMQYLSSAGGTSEIGRVDAANVAGVFGLPEENEDINVFEVSRHDAISMLNSGKFSNASTIIGLQWLALHGDSLRARWLSHDNSVS